MALTIPLAVILLGALLALPMLDDPRYADPNWREQFLDMRPMIGQSDPASTQFYEAQAQNLTEASHQLAHGSALLGLGFSLLALFMVIGVRRLSDIGNLMTPSTRGLVVLWALAAWWGWVPAQAAWLAYTLDRGDYPPWADTTAIPIAGAIFFCILGTPFVVAAAHLATRGAKLPSTLWADVRGLRAAGAALLAAPPLAWFLFVGYRAFLEGDFFSMPVAVAGTSATLVVWASAAAPRWALTNASSATR